MVTTRHDLVPLDRIRLDGGTQTRAGLDQDTVKEYADAYQAGEQLPPVVLFDDGERLWMADGFHRYGGAKLAGRKDIEAEIVLGTARDALLYSAGCNGTHGLRRTNADKTAAVKALLKDKEWAGRSDNWVAEACRVSQPFVATVRASMHQRVSNRATSNIRSCRAGRDGRSRRPRAKGGAPQPGGGPPKLCQLCTRIGVATCDKCRTAATAAQAPKPDRGETVEQEMQRTSAAIESFCRKVMALVEAEMPSDPWLDHEGKRTGALQKFTDGCGMLRLGKCTHVCPACQGTKTDDRGQRCGPCLGAGRMPKAFYDQAV
jgi:hypothetical protein